ncbi:MAG TPA: DUF916 domain-containing protein [Candidatus Saccharimonadales bacterium]|nr:DUF916 domain-containing protein [Candidatus Saccharimonadales bacterium]
MKKRFSSILGAALAVLFSVVNVMPVSAAQGSSGLSITPKKNYIIKPGQTITDKLTIGNLDKENDLAITLRMIDFTFTNLSGTPKLSLAQNAPQTPWSLKPFTTLPKTVTVPASQTRTVEYSITIPKNQGAGSYYSAILYQAGGANGGNVALNASGVTLAFVSVPGTVSENMKLQKFGAYTSDDQGTTGHYTFIATGGTPKMVAYALKNEGNVFENPAGNVVIKDMFGHQVANVITNPNQSLALLGQTRLFTTCIRTVQQKIQALGGTSKNTACADPHMWPGRYTMHLDAFYGQNGNLSKEITADAVVWILPWWFLILLVIVLGALTYGIWWTQRKLKALVRGTTYKSGRGFSRRSAR